MSRTISIILAVFTCFQVFAFDKEELKHRMDSLMRDPLLETSQVGFMLWDLESDSMLYAYNHKQMMRPASTMKILTAVTALDNLPTDYRFETTAYTIGTKDSTFFNGNIYIRGGMDPSFNQSDMKTLAAAVSRLGIDSINGHIVVDLSFKDTLTLGQGWCWDDDNPILQPLIYCRKNTFLPALHKVLSEEGIRVSDPDEIGHIPVNAQALINITTPLDNILERMLKRSDNLYAESVLMQLSAGEEKKASAKQSLKKVSKMLTNAGVKADNYRLADGSGLSLYNYLTPETEVAVLRYAYQSKKIYPRLLRSLPIAGIDGTISDRLKKDSTRGKIYAKTGTLTGVSSLAGYILIPDQKPMAFCIINQGILNKKKAHKFQDEILYTIASIIEK